MDKWNGKVALVTGASVGIGKSLVKELVRYGMIVVGVARQVDLVEKLAIELKNEKGKLIPKMCDLLKEDDIRSVFIYIENNLGGISIIVNMASYNTLKNMLIRNTDTEIMKIALEINVVAAALFCKLGISSMKKHNIDGHIINVGGAPHFYISTIPEHHFYSTTNYIMRALTDGLRMEFRSNNMNIRISIIGLGAVKANTLQNSGFKDDDFYEIFKIYASEVFKIKKDALPGKIPINCDGDGLYDNKIIASLELPDVIDCFIKILASPQGCEVMDLVAEPTYK